MECIVCRKEIDDKEQYACVWGHNNEVASIVGFAHLSCADRMKDITNEVTGSEEQIKGESKNAIR